MMEIGNIFVILQFKIKIVKREGGGGRKACTPPDFTQFLRTH